MQTLAVANDKTYSLLTLPGDDVRQIMWRYQDRYDVQMLVQSTRSVARGLIARLVADGERNTHEWTPKKDQMLKAFDDAQITSAFMEPEMGGFIIGPKLLAMCLIAYELAWVDAGAATCSMASHLALAPIHERGTKEQKEKYMPLCVPPQPGDDRKVWRGSFVLTEPLPYVGVNTEALNGKMRISQWKAGEEPIIQIEKRGRFITNMGFANFVTAAVESDDPRIKGTCMVILEETDEGVFDRGAPILKLVHQLSSTRDPIFNLKVSANRIVGGYTIKDGVIIPNYGHGEIIEAVFRRTRVTAAVMSAAKLMSAIEPVIRYHRTRFRGGSSATPGTPRYDLGIQQKEDAQQRLVDIWATAEAASSLGFESARLLDDFDPIERKKDAYFQQESIKGGRAQMRAFKPAALRALEYLEMSYQPENERDSKRYQELSSDTLAQYLIMDSLLNVLVPAGKLWNTGYGATVMREAVSLMGGYGITEDCPGFLPQKWMDAQLEATYEGPEAVQRRQLSVTMTNEVFLKQFEHWIAEMRHIASNHPDLGACTLASTMQLWQWTLQHLLHAEDAKGRKLYQASRQGVTFSLADALSWIVASRSMIMDYLELEKKGPENPNLAEGMTGILHFHSDLCHVQSSRCAGEVGRITTELVYGYNRHPSWEEAGQCLKAEDVDAMESCIPGYAGCVRALNDVIEANGTHTEKAGPCVKFKGYEQFARLRSKLDGCLTGSRLAKDRAANALTGVMIPEALDYPV
ncbi:MAG: acyl-CoA dehydrogenase family protein [Chlamydiota bacterium]|nr:acyl-CoA dehydrogenase family protein [Chlamydiota bacterium]